MRKAYGSTNPFSVPEGYFDTLAERLAQRLPAQKAVVIAMQPRWYRYRKALLGAACSLGVMLAVGSLYRHTGTRPQPVAVQVQAQDQVMEELADYAMLDNEAIYASLSEN